jgi:hypothetical protein
MKKVNKKAIFGMLVAMILSLGMTGEINGQNHDSNLQQIGAGASYMASETEGGLSNAFSYLADGCKAISTVGASAGLANIYISGTNPYGWSYWIGCGALFL